MKKIHTAYRGPLYHLIGFEELKYIVDHDKLKARGHRGISTTRDKNLNYYVGSPVHVPFKLELNGTKLSQKYKIKPAVDESYTGVRFTEEREERIYTREIPNIWKYVNKLIFIADKIKQSSQYFKHWGIKEVVEKYLPEIASKNIPFYVQHGTQIIKDDTFLQKYGFLKKTSSSLFRSPTIQTKQGPIDLEIFQNPEKYEVREIKDYSEFSKETTPFVKFFIDFTKKSVFIWNGQYGGYRQVAGLIHLDIGKTTTISGLATITPEYELNAVAIYKGNRHYEDLKWDWLDKYFLDISDNYLDISVDVPPEKITALYNRVPRVLDQLNNVIKYFVSVLNKQGLSTKAKDWQLDKKHMFTGWTFKYTKPLDRAFEYFGKERPDFGKMVRAYFYISQDRHKLRSPRKLEFRIDLSYEGSESLMQDVVVPYQDTITIPLVELLMKNKKITMDDFYKIIEEEKESRKAKYKNKEEAAADWLETWVDVAFSTKPTALGKELENLLPYIPKEFKTFNQFPYLYRCVSINTEYLNRIDTESLSIHMSQTKFTSWTYDLSAAKTFGARYHQSTPTHTTIIIRKSTNKLHPLLNVFEYAKYLSRKHLLKNTHNTLDITSEEDEIIVKMPAGFTIEPSDIYLEMKYPENKWQRT